MADNTNDFSISKAYNVAWEAIKKNKVLWIFGAALSSIASYNYSSNSNFLKNFSTTPPPTQELPQKVSQVLGVSTSSSISTPLSQMLTQLFSQVPSYLYLLIGLDILFAVIVFMILQIIYRAWLSGSLLSGSQFSIHGKNVSIKDSSLSSFNVLKRFIWLELIPILAIFASILLLVGVFYLIFFLPFSEAKIVAIIFGILAMIAISITMLVVSMTLIFAPRKVIAENSKAKDAFFSSLKLVKQKFFRIFWLGLVNIIASTAVIAAVAIPLIIAIASSAIFGAIFESLRFPLITLAILIFLVFIFFAVLLGGIIQAFKAVVWTHVYSNLKGKYD